MNGLKLQDRLYLGLGRSARYVGRSADAYRPQSPFAPLDPTNRFLRLPATFVSAKGSEMRTNAYGEALCHGIFDGSYTRVGDYIVMPTGIFFVASQSPLLPILCVRTNRTISLSRPNMQSAPAANVYGGYTSGQSSILMTDWPASVLGESRSSASETKLPGEQAIPYWAILLPAHGSITLSPGDIVTDDIGRTAVIAASELTDLGWRISARMATT
jgi:hypothetical protein